MPTPISPVISKDLIQHEVVFAKDQPQYIPLPAYVDPNGVVVTRWKFSFKERLNILFRGCIWLELLTFGRPLQPVRLSVDSPTVEKTNEDVARQFQMI